MNDDAARFAKIDQRISGSSRVSDKRTKSGVRRYVRPVRTGYKALAACGCSAVTVAIDRVCTVCGGAELFTEELRV